MRSSVSKLYLRRGQSSLRPLIDLKNDPKAVTYAKVGVLSLLKHT
jgi:hypothetical protein